MDNNDTQSFACQIAEVGYWITHLNDLGFPGETTRDLAALARQLRQDGHFRTAQVGKGTGKRLASWIRRDEISWITDWSRKPLPLIRQLLGDIEFAARRGLFLPLKRFEAHFSVYPDGAFYKAHVDRHRSLPSRLLTFVLYLNDLGGPLGGELKLYPKEQEPVTIEPLCGRLVVFDSRIRHEVRPTVGERWSLTAWLRNDEIVGIEGI